MIFKYFASIRDGQAEQPLRIALSCTWTTTLPTLSVVARPRRRR